MTKLDDIDDFFKIDAVLDGDTDVLPVTIRTHLRNMLVASELGHLVIVQFTTEDTHEYVYIMCAHIHDAHMRCRLLPICRLPADGKLLAGLRPPPGLSKNAFARPAYNPDMQVDVVEDRDGQLVMAALCVEEDGGNSNVH